jgi:hypothetical protein
MSLQDRSESKIHNIHALLLTLPLPVALLFASDESMYIEAEAKARLHRAYKLFLEKSQSLIPLLESV